MISYILLTIYIIAFVLSIVLMVVSIADQVRNDDKYYGIQIGDRTVLIATEETIGDIISRKVYKTEINKWKLWR